MFSVRSQFISFLSLICLTYLSCSKGTSASGKQKVIVEMEVGYDPRLTTKSSRLNFYFTRKPGLLVNKYLPNQISFDTSWAVYLNSGDTLKMIDPSDSLYAVFMINNKNVTKPGFYNGGSLIEYYVQP